MKEFFEKYSIALIALIISLVNFYIANLRKFKLKVRDAGRIVISKNPHDLKKLMILLDLIFENDGGSKGIVEDVAIILLDNGNKIVLNALYTNNDRTINYSKELPPPKLETFIGFQLDKDVSLIKQIAFYQHEDDAPFSFTKGLYKANILVLSSKNDKWKKVRAFDFEIDNDDIQILNEMKQIPQPDGGFFLKWVTRDKLTLSTKNRRSLLKTIA